MTVAAEIALRRRRFGELADTDGVVGVPASALREEVEGLRIYFGGQGVGYDANRTKTLAESGVTVGLPHAGRHHPDDLLGDGVLYHYPVTASRGRTLPRLKPLRTLVGLASLSS